MSRACKLIGGGTSTATAMPAITACSATALSTAWRLTPATTSSTDLKAPTPWSAASATTAITSTMRVTPWSKTPAKASIPSKRASAMCLRITSRTWFCFQRTLCPMPRRPHHQADRQRAGQPAGRQRRRQHPQRQSRRRHACSGSAGNDSYFVDNAERQGRRGRRPGHRQRQYVGELHAGSRRGGRNADARPTPPAPTRSTSDRQRARQHRHRQCRRQYHQRRSRQRHPRRHGRPRHPHRRRRQRHVPVQHRAQRRHQCRHHHRLLGGVRHHPAGELRCSRRSPPSAV